MTNPRSFPRSLLFLWSAASILMFAWLWRGWSDLQPMTRAGPPYASGEWEALATDRLQAQLQTNLHDPDLLAQYGLALLQRARETGNFDLQVEADKAFETALLREAGQVDALIGLGQLALSRHDFRGALGWAEEARFAAPYRSEPLGIQVDAYVELGAYDNALATAEEMIDLRPDLASISRVAYLRELYGAMPAAIEAMETAAQTGAPGHENTLWALTELGWLHFRSGNNFFAEAAFRRALDYQPDYTPAQKGLATLAAAKGNFTVALAHLEQLSEYNLDPAIPQLAAEIHLMLGNEERALEQFKRVRTLHKLHTAVGVDILAEQALFEASFAKDKDSALALALVAYANRPTIFAADALSWALYKSGELDAAWRYNQSALRLGTREALFYYHGGVIALAMGEEAAARDYLLEALRINPSFSIVQAAHADELLTGLSPAAR